MNDLITLFVTAGGVIVALFTLVWLIQLRTKNAGIVDSLWAISFPIMTIIYFFMIGETAIRQIVLLTLVCLWGFRLGLHLISRTIGHPEDVRYAALRKEWGAKENVMMLRFFYFQAILAIVLSYPFAVIMSNRSAGLTPLEITGAVIWLIAFIGESVADNQLRTFKKNPVNKGKVMDKGLWYYSRHPNYFFEWLTWVSFFVIALAAPYGYVSVFCPILMWIFLTKVTGIKYTEEQMVKSRGQLFLDYQKTTSSFFPLPKRHS